MGPEGFKRCDGFVGSIPQNFVNANLPVCPMCGNTDPYWTLKDKIEFAGNRVMFRCKDCGAVLSATVADFSGETKSTAFAVLTTAGAVNALAKKKQGKDVKTVYVRVEDSGSFRTTNELVGKEFPLDEMKAISQAAACAPVPAAPVAEAVPAAPVEEIKVSYADSVPAAPAEEIKVSYATPAEDVVPTAVFAAPAASVEEVPAAVCESKAEEPVRVSYAAPAAPEAAVETAAPSKKPLGSMILMCAALGCFLIQFIIMLASRRLFRPNFSTLLTVAGAAMMLVGTIQYKKPLFFGIGLSIFALRTLFGMFPVRGVFILFDLIILAAFVLMALYYFLSGKKLNAVLKLVSAIAAIASEFILCIRLVSAQAGNLIYAPKWVPVTIVFYRCFAFLTVALVCVAAILFTLPSKKEENA